MRSFAGLLVVFLLVGDALAAETAVLAPIADAAMYSEGVNNGNGSGEFIFVGKNSGGGFRRSPIKFDIAGALPAGAEITAVSLQVTAANTQGTNNPATIYRLTEDWLEGATNAGGSEGSGAAAAVGDTTWASRNFNTVAWTTPGGTFTVAGTDTINMSGSGTYTWPTSATLVAAAQDWLDTPAGNFGWILTGDETTAGSTAKQIHSRATSFTPPALTITYLLASYDPALTLSPTAQTTINVGQTINYSLEVGADLINGDGSDASNLVVSGSVSGAFAYASGDTSNDGILQSGETWTFTGSYVALASDPDTLNNTITVDFEDERGDPRAENTSASTTVNHLDIAQASPASVSATEGDTVQFSVLASGGYGNYDYAWTADTGSGPVPVPSSNNATLTLSNVALSQAGTYVCEASDIEESATAAPFTLTVAAQVPLGGPVLLALLAAALGTVGATALARNRRAATAAASTRTQR